MPARDLFEGAAEPPLIGRVKTFPIQVSKLTGPTRLEGLGHGRSTACCPQQHSIRGHRSDVVDDREVVRIADQVRGENSSGRQAGSPRVRTHFARPKLANKPRKDGTILRTTTRSCDFKIR